MSKRNTSNNLVGVTGEYYACAELGKKGILALLTPKNNPLFDIVAVMPNTLKTVIIQVKTRSTDNDQGWKFGVDICDIQEKDNLFVVLINLMNDKETEFYIYQYDELAIKIKKIYDNYLATPKKNGEKRKETDFRWFNESDYRNDTDHLNRKNNWGLLGLNLNDLL